MVLGEMLIICAAFMILIGFVDYHYVKVGDVFIKDFFKYRVVKKGYVLSEIELLKNGSEEGTGRKEKISNIRLSMTCAKSGEFPPKMFGKLKN